MNQYLFDQCFNPDISSKNYQHFLDYLLTHLGHSFDGPNGFNYIPSVEQYTVVLDRARLLQYWREHRQNILRQNFTATGKRVVTHNYTATYTTDLPAVYQLLDDLLGSEPANQQAQPE